MSISDRVDQVKQLKREGNLEGALAILERWIEEEESNPESFGVAPWPYEQIAIIRRKRKELDLELAILERYFSVRNTGGSSNDKLAMRLLRSYELNELIDYREESGQRVAYYRGNGVRVDLLDIFAGYGAILDTETTGLTGKDEMVELAVILFKYSKHSGEVIEVVDSYTGLQEPKCKISSGAIEVHGLKKKDLKGHRIDTDRVQSILDRAEIIISHNASFDRRYVSKLFPAAYYSQWYCSMNGIPWKKMGFSSKALQALMRDHGIQEAQVHRAMNDAEMTLRLISTMDQETGKPYLFQLMSSRPLKFNESHYGQSGGRLEVRIGASEEDEGRGKGCLVAVFVIVVLIILIKLLS